MRKETKDVQTIGGLRLEYKIYEHQKCFVGHSHEAEWRDDILSACVEVLPKFGLEPWYAADHFDPTEPLRDKVVKLIANARYGIYDLSSWRDKRGEWHPPRNVLIELGMSIALNRPALLVRHTSNETLPLPVCLHGIELLDFAGETTLKRTLEERLPQWFDVPPDRDWLARFCTFGNRGCSFREEHPRARQWGNKTLHCHASDGLDQDHPCFQKIERDEIRGAFGEIFSRYDNLAFDYLDELPSASGYQFLLCSFCQTVRSTPFAVYRISPHTTAGVFIAIGMSIALETLFEYDIPKVLLVRQEQDLPSLLRGYEVIEASGISEAKRKLRGFIPSVIQKARKATWKPRPLPFVEVMTPTVDVAALSDIAENPLQSIVADLQDVIAAFSSDLNESMTGQMVTMAGVISYIRPHTTRKGASMAFVGFEDLQGSVEIVVFPRLWKETQKKWQTNNIVVVRGIVDAKGRKPKIICEAVTDQVRVVEADQSHKPPPPSGPLLAISIRRSGNHATDVERLNLIYELLTASDFMGNDRFQFHLLGDTRGGDNLELVFPNNRTRVCPELLQELVSILGPDCYTVIPNQ